jgi:hypothetical protein
MTLPLKSAASAPSQSAEIEKAKGKASALSLVFLMLIRTCLRYGRPVGYVAVTFRTDAYLPAKSRTQALAPRR